MKAHLPTLFNPEGTNARIQALSPTVYHDYTINRNMLTGAPATDMLTTTRTSNAMYTDAQGNLINFTSNTARIGNLGLLVESSKTNLLKYSNTPSNAAWGKSATITVTPLTTVVAPDGSTDVSRVEKTASAFSNIRQSFSSTATSHAVSVYAKPGTLNHITLLVTGDSAATYARVNFDLVNRIYTNTSLTTVVDTTSIIMEPCANGWIRVGFSATFTSATGCQCYIYPGRNNDAIAGSVFMFGAQVEVSSFVTSYVPTTAMTATRNQDIISFTDPTIFSLTEGTIFIEYDRVLQTDQRPFAIAPDLTTSNLIAFQSSVSVAALMRFNVHLGGAAQVQATVNNPDVSGTTYKNAGAYKLNDSAAVGSATKVIATDTSCTMPSGTCAYARLGTFGTSRSIEGHIKRFAWFNRRLTNNELLALVG